MSTTVHIGKHLSYTFPVHIWLKQGDALTCNYFWFWSRISHQESRRESDTVV